jgi:hypothetical protein
MRAFSIEEANELVPTLHRIVSRLMLQKDVITARVEALHTRLGFLPRDFSPLLDDDGDVVDLKREAAESLAAFEAGWAEVSDLGGVVKDPKEGLVDFYGRLEEDDDEFVWLCWRFGEERIAFYHGLEEGFAQRKPLPHAPATHPLLSLAPPPPPYFAAPAPLAPGSSPCPLPIAPAPPLPSMSFSGRWATIRSASLLSWVPGNGWPRHGRSTSSLERASISGRCSTPRPSPRRPPRVTFLLSRCAI